jgi:formiminotetrahydrofolate cyclodeaminase
MSPKFLEALARPQPDPGGGSAAAFGARVALALMEKVVRLEYQRPRNSDESRAFWEKTWQEIQEIGYKLEDLQEGDIRAYFHLTRALAGDDEVALARAVQEAVQCPGEIIIQAHRALNLLISIGPKCRSYLISDLQVACELLGGALLGAYYIARANLPLFRDDQDRRREKARLHEWRDTALASRNRARAALNDRAP